MKRKKHIQVSSYENGRAEFVILCNPRRRRSGTQIAGIVRPEHATCRRCLRSMIKLLQSRMAR